MPASDDLSIWLELPFDFPDVYGGFYSGMWDPLYAVVSRWNSRDGGFEWGEDLVPPARSALDNAQGGIWIWVSEEEVGRIREETDRILAGTYDDQLSTEPNSDGDSEMDLTYRTAEDMRTALSHARHPRVSFRSVGSGNRRKPGLDIEAQLAKMEGVKRKSKPKKGKKAQPAPKPQPGKPFWMASQKPAAVQPKQQPKPLSTMLQQARMARQQAQRKGKQAERLMTVPVETALERARMARAQAARRGAEAERLMTGAPAPEPVHVPSMKLPQHVELVEPRRIMMPLPRRPHGAAPSRTHVPHGTHRPRAGSSYQEELFSTTSPEAMQGQSEEGSVLGSAAAWVRSLIDW